MQYRSISSGACGLVLLAAAGIAYPASLSTADKQFLTTAAKADMTEANEGKIAENQAARGDVRDLGKTIAQDHTENYSQLAALAAQDGVSIPTGIDTGKDRTIQQLVHLKGASFDRTFTADEIAAHRQAIAIFKREAEHGQDPDVKAFATKTIPVLEKHLQMAETCAKAARHS
jgi:putative membrane protein